MNKRILTLYGRRGCHLCADMAAALKPLLAGTSVALETVDIDNAPALKARFDCEVPLLFEGEVEILRHEFDATAFDAWLREVRLAGPALHSL